MTSQKPESRSARHDKPRPEPQPDALPADAPSINLDESPLAWLARRKDKDGRPLLSDAEVNAGERLRADFTFAQMTPRVTANWSNLTGESGRRRGAPGHGIEMADHVVAARERVRLALAAVGPELAGVLIDVCCFLKGLEVTEKASGWPQRTGRIVLTIALRHLARHYGYVAAPPNVNASRARPNHWGTPDYRPKISAEEEPEAVNNGTPASRAG